MRPAAAADGYTTLSWVIEATKLQVVLVARVWCAQSSAPHMTYHPLSSVRPRSLVVVPVLLLPLNASCKWVALMSADAGTLAADVAKLLERSGRLGRHRDATFSFGARCFEAACWSSQRLLRWQLSRISGTTTTSRTPTIITDERQLFAASKGVWPRLELAAALPHTCLCARTDVGLLLS